MPALPHAADHTSPATFTVSVPVTVPDFAAIVREAALEAARELNQWLTFKDAAAYLRVSFRTFERKKKELGLPVVEIDGVKRILRADLDAALLAHLKTPANPIIHFPSTELRSALIAKTVAA
jgi:hypothetical protein